MPTQHCSQHRITALWWYGEILILEVKKSHKLRLSLGNRLPSAFLQYEENSVGVPSRWLVSVRKRLRRLLSHRKMRQGTHHCLGISPRENKDSRFLLLMHGIAKFWTFIHIYNYSFLIWNIRTLLLPWVAYNLSAWMPQLIWSWNATDPKSRTELDIELKIKNSFQQNRNIKASGLRK